MTSRPESARFEAGSFDAYELAALKRDMGLGVSVCIPACNEAGTVGQVAGAVQDKLVDAAGLVDEVLVVDDGSADATAEVAQEAGARVLRLPSTQGKGAAMRRGLEETSGDIVVYCDADLYSFDPQFVVGLAGPLLTQPELVLVKASYDRPLGTQPGEGGRVTQLVARPLLAILFPGLAWVSQPLAGETAARRSALQRVEFEAGYGVETGLLIDIARLFGTGAIAQCHLGERRHRNRPLAELAPQAETIMRVALRRAGLLPAG
ncbi:MAG TPA: glucosyl-3-phosphoglycerate synthase [Acidimicrobiales bacterium]|nr:glucosyl-3-phosphoglycerate synthase [Acidimicrobiales bacterium]